MKTTKKQEQELWECFDRGFRPGAFTGRFKENTIVVPIGMMQMIFEIFEPELRPNCADSDLRYWSEKYAIYIEIIR